MFESRDTSDPSLVYQNDLILFRAIHPDKEIPPPSRTTLAMLEPPRSIKLAQENLETVMSSAFPTLAKTRKLLARPGTSVKKDKTES